MCLVWWYSYRSRSFYTILNACINSPLFNVSLSLSLIHVEILSSQTPNRGSNPSSCTFAPIWLLSSEKPSPWAALILSFSHFLIFPLSATPTRRPLSRRTNGSRRLNTASSQTAGRLFNLRLPPYCGDLCLSLFINHSPAQQTMSFSDFTKIETVTKLNEYLKDKSYIEGYVHEPPLETNSSHFYLLSLYFHSAPLRPCACRWWLTSLVHVYEADSRPAVWVSNGRLLTQPLTEHIHMATSGKWKMENLKKKFSEMRNSDFWSKNSPAAGY